MEAPATAKEAAPGRSAAGPLLYKETGSVETKAFAGAGAFTVFAEADVTVVEVYYESF